MMGEKDDVVVDDGEVHEGLDYDSESDDGKT